MAEGGRLTWFPFNVGDWLADDRVAVMGWKLRGAYIDLLARMWNRAQGGGDCSVPDDDAYIGGVLGATPEEVSEIRARLIEGPMAVFQKVDGRLVNKRLLREFEQAIAFVKSASDAGKVGAERRWGQREATPKASPKRRHRAPDGHPMGSSSGRDRKRMRSPQGFDGSPHTQEQVPVQEEKNSVPVETTSQEVPLPRAERAAPTDGSKREVTDGTKLLRHFEARFAERSGTAYFRKGATEGALADKIVRQIPLDEAQRRAGAYLDDTYWADHGGYTFEGFFKSVNRYVPGAPPIGAARAAPLPQRAMTAAATSVENARRLVEEARSGAR